jgi:hypothetical protein
MTIYKRDSKIIKPFNLISLTLLILCFTLIKAQESFDDPVFIEDIEGDYELEEIDFEDSGLNTLDEGRAL